MLLDKLALEEEDSLHFNNLTKLDQNGARRTLKENMDEVLVGKKKKRAHFRVVQDLLLNITRNPRINPQILLNSSHSFQIQCKNLINHHYDLDAYSALLGSTKEGIKRVIGMKMI